MAQDFYNEKGYQACAARRVAAAAPFNASASACTSTAPVLVHARDSTMPVEVHELSCSFRCGWWPWLHLGHIPRGRVTKHMRACKLACVWSKLTRSQQVGPSHKSTERARPHVLSMLHAAQAWTHGMMAGRPRSI